jgi:hypothetical protein
MEQLKALARVCDKRYDRLCNSGLNDAQAAQKIAVYLNGWIARHGKFLSNKELEFANSLLDGYTADI